MEVTTYLQGHDTDTLKSHRSRTVEKQAQFVMPYIVPESRILDVGCGPGTITCGFAKYALDGSVTGVDYSEDVLKQARAESQIRGVENNTIFVAARAHELPFDDESFDLVYCNALLVHVPDAAGVLKEMRRVCKTGGHVACREPDWSTCVIHPRLSPLERWKEVYMELKRREEVESNAGRHLAEWAIAAGFSPDAIQVTSDVLEYFGKDQVRWWGELYAARMRTEFGERAEKSGITADGEVDQFAASYLEWSKSEGAIWTLTHMRLLCQK